MSPRRIKVAKSPQGAPTQVAPRRGAAEMDMRNARVAALVAALTVGSPMALAENPPAQAPKKPSTQTQAPRPPVTIVPAGPAVAPPPAKSGEPGTFDDKQRALVAKVSNYLSNVQTLVGDFVQVGPDGRRTE